MNYFGYDIGTVADFYIAPICFFLIIYISRHTVKINDPWEQKVFNNALILKLLSGLLICAIYIFYYKGGDTIIYMHDALILENVFWKLPSDYFDFLFNGMYDTEKGRINLWKHFFHLRDYNLEYFSYRHDERAFFVARLASICAIITGGSFYSTSMLFGTFAAIGVWKLYKIFAEYYPVFKRQLIYTVIFIPSVMFWGAGVLKDPITFGALCFLMHNFHNILKRRNIASSVIGCLIYGFILLAIKPYILNAFIVGIGSWVLSNYLVKIKSVVFQVLLLPLLLGFSIGIVMFFLDVLGSDTGKYSLEKVLDEAALVQNDLKQDYYGGHRFDIGTFEPTIGGVLSKAPIAIFTTLYRPFIWEAKNIFVFISALEATVILIFTFIAIFRIKIYNLQGILLINPILFFSFIFSLFFSFFLGLTTANFGALVRYKIPLMPFYVSMVYILSNYAKVPKKQKD